MARNTLVDNQLSRSRSSFPRGLGRFFGSGLRSADLLLFTFVGDTPPTIVVKTTTGYARGIRWDGVNAPVAGTGDSGADITVDWGTAPAAPFDTQLQKQIAVASVDSGGALSGYVTSLTTSGTDGVPGSGAITAFRGGALTQMTNLSIAFHDIEHLDLSRAASLVSVDLRGNGLTSLDVSDQLGSDGGDSLDISNNLLAAEDLTAIFRWLGTPAAETGSPQLYAQDNPGWADSSHTAATSKGWTFYP